VAKAAVFFGVFEEIKIMNEGLLFALVAAVLALLYGIISIKWILGLPTGNDRMREIAAAVQEGAQAYLNRQSASRSAPSSPASPATSA
jgi:hypothetical protein